MFNIFANFLQETYLKRSLLSIIYIYIYIYIYILYIYVYIYSLSIYIYIQMLSSFIFYIWYIYTHIYIYYILYINIYATFDVLQLSYTLKLGFFYVCRWDLSLSLSLSYTEINAKVCSVTSQLSQSISKCFHLLRSYQCI